MKIGFSVVTYEVRILFVLGSPGFESFGVFSFEESLRGRCPAQNQHHVRGLKLELSPNVDASGSYLLVPGLDIVSTRAPAALSFTRPTDRQTERVGRSHPPPNAKVQGFKPLEAPTPLRTPQET